MSRATPVLARRLHRPLFLALAACLAGSTLCCVGIRWAGQDAGLCAGAPEARTVDIWGGATVAEVAAVLESAGLADAVDVELAAHDEAVLRALGLRSVEGYLAPGRYRFTLGTSPEELLARLVDEQRRRLTVAQRVTARAALGLSDEELLTLASLLERETRDPRERQQLARLWVARLHRGLPLHSRALRAAQSTGCSESDLGDALLPAEPVGSPSRATIDAVLAADPSGHPVQFEEGRFAIDAGERTALDAVESDPAPSEITRGTHYYVSNESHHDAFHDAVAQLGGVQVGVGTDQNYLLAGWSRPELLVLTDFDQAVVDLHRVYRVAFLSSASPDDFVNLWQFGQRKRLRELVVAAYPEGPSRRAALAALAEARATVAWRLVSTRASYLRRGLPTYLTDRDQYTYVRSLFAARRVVMMRADLRRDGALQQLGRTLAEHGRTVRVLYLSNAEQYFRYDASFRRNVSALPYDAFSVVLRTRPVDADYAYVVQPHDDLRAWLAAPRVHHVSSIVPLTGLRVGQRVLLAGGPAAR